MSKLPDAVPCPDKPPLHLKGGYLCVASPVDLTEACFSVPAVRALRRFRPHSTLSVLCPESLAPLWRTEQGVDEVIVYPDKASARKIERILKGSKVELESSIAWEAGEAAKAFARANVLQRLGYPAAGLEKFLTDRVEVVVSPGPITHRVRHYLDFVNKLGGDALVRENFRTLPLARIPEKPCIVLAPASEYGGSFEWPIERFKEVVDVMVKKHPEMDWVIFRAGEETGKSDVCAELAGLLGGGAKDCCREWSMEKMLQVLPRCSALLACDGEVAHLAAHVGLPAVVIFGPNEPEWKRPLGRQSRVVSEHVACSPCFLTKCQLDHRCQHEITVEMVVAELDAALAARG